MVAYSLLPVAARGRLLLLDGLAQQLINQVKQRNVATFLQLAGDRFDVFLLFHCNPPL